MADPKEIKHVEKALAQEAKHEIKNLTEAHKSLDQAIRASASAFKDEEKAYAQQEKASKLENRAYHETKHLEHKHENALKDQQTSQQQMELAKQHHDQLNAEVQAKKGLLDEVTSRHHELVSERTATIQTLRKAPDSPAPVFTRDSANATTTTPIAAAHAHPDSKPPIVATSPLDADVEAKERAQAEDNARLEKKMAEANLDEKPVGTERHVRIGEDEQQVQGQGLGHGVDETRQRSVESEMVGGGMNKGFVQPGATRAV